MATLKAMTADTAHAPALDFAVVDPDDEDASRLRRAMEEEASRLYHDRDGSIHTTSATPEELRPPSGAFIIGRAGGRAIGCGGFKRLDDRTCEIKRMYLEPAWRGRGLARELLEAIEDAARAAGYSLARLDTGDRQPAAERIYDSAGYHRIPDYNANPLARHWFERTLERGARPREG